MAVKSLIETITVGAGGATSMLFDNIPNDLGQDLVLLISSRSSVNADHNAGWIKFNGSATDPAARILASFDGAAPISISWRYTQRINGGTSTANTFSNTSIYISNYASSATKSYSSDVVTENNSANTSLMLTAGTWAVTDPITSLEVISHSSTSPYVQHTTASLYKIKYD